MLLGWSWINFCYCLSLLVYYKSIVFRNIVKPKFDYCGVSVVEDILLYGLVKLRLILELVVI